MYIVCRRRCEIRKVFFFLDLGEWLFGDLQRSDGKSKGLSSREIKTIVIFFFVCRDCFTGNN